MKDCPICHGQGKLGDDIGIAAVSARKPFISQLAELIPDGLMSYMLGMFVVAALAWILNTWITAPPSPPKPAEDTPEMQCSKACGGGTRFRAYTYPTTGWNENDGSKFGKAHPPIPARCDCVTTPEVTP